MAYSFSKIVDYNFSDAVTRATEELKKEGFGVLHETDISATLKNKLNVDFRNYRILGACNPSFAYQALLAEDEIGTMLPCNVIVQETDGGEVKVSAVDPAASMMAIKNDRLEKIAGEVGDKLKRVIHNL